MYCFFFFSCFYYTIFKFWPQASIWAHGLPEASSFLYLVMNVNRCFYYTKAECHFSFVVFCHSFQFPSDITTFSPKSENIPFGLFSKKGPKCCTLHMKVLSHRREVLPEREWMTEKKKNRDTLGTMQIHSTKQYWRWEGGCFRFGFSFWVLVFSFLQLPSWLTKATAFPQHKET